MGEIHLHTPVLPILAAFSRYDEALDWARRQAAEAWGPIALESPRFEFVETDYYAPTMGEGLKKCFWAFAGLRDPAELIEWKIAANRWEAEYARQAGHGQTRPLNLDPGYLTPAKLVLASTKDHAHRIYLGRGIYAEVTLYFKDRRWQDREWTFPDYRRADYQQFFAEARQLLHARQKAAPTLRARQPEGPMLDARQQEGPALRARQPEGPPS
jgi:uncharacterized protein DUF4416